MKLTGHKAIEAAETNANLVLNKYEDPTEGARVVTLDQAKEIAREDAGLIWAETDYSEYTLPLSGDPSCYGDPCTPERAEEITDKIASMVEQEFPGIRVDRKPLIGAFKVQGPDDSVCDEIHQWVQDNWKAAL